MVRQFFIVTVCIFFFAHCKKDTDTVTQHDIKGMVYNNCTDSGLANVTVFFKDGQGLNSSVVSDGVGNFNFPNVSINDNSKYTYSIYIPSKSGIGATTPEYCGFNGTTLGFNYNEADMFFKPRVTPKYLYFCMDFNPSVTIPNGDSISVYYYQKTFHKNVPTLPYDGTVGKYGIYDPGCGSNYPMGLWHLEIKKWKSSVYTFVKDSVYLTWGANTTYTINW